MDNKNYIAKLEMENQQLRAQIDAGRRVPGNWAAENQCEQAQTQSGMGAQVESPESTIDWVFTFHDDPDKAPHYVEIREAAKQFAKVVVRHTPGGGDRVIAVQKIREAVMFANACVALSGRA